MFPKMGMQCARNSSDFGPPGVRTPVPVRSAEASGGLRLAGCFGGGPDLISDALRPAPLRAGWCLGLRVVASAGEPDLGDLCPRFRCAGEPACGCVGRALN